MLHDEHPVDKEGVFAALQAAGLSKAVGAYSGSGDDGWVDDVTYFRDGKVIDDDTFDGESKLTDMVRALSLQVLPSGWEINEGSNGEIVFDVAEKKVTVHHSWHVVHDEKEVFNF